LLLHGPSGEVIQINPEQVTVLRSPGDRTHFIDGANCMISMTDGKFVAVAEDCATVLKLMDSH